MMIVARISLGKVGGDGVFSLRFDSIFIDDFISSESREALHTCWRLFAIVSATFTRCED
jgi:hypothetical protein